MLTVIHICRYTAKSCQELTEGDRLHFRGLQMLGVRLSFLSFKAKKRKKNEREREKNPSSVFL